jgi:SAM-dependent methyltransferase
MKTYPERQQAFWRTDKSSRRSANHPVVAWIYGTQARKLKAFIPAPIHSIADCGCGNGFFQFYLEREFGAPCIGIDFSIEMLRINPCANKTCSSAMSLPFPDNSFDLVTCSMLLHHLSRPDQRRAMGEMSRIARHYVFIAEPVRNNVANVVFALSRRNERGLLPMGTRYLRQLCDQSGLEVLDIYVDALLLPNVTPLWLLPLMRKLDATRLSSRLGFTRNILCRPRRVSAGSRAHRR